MAADQPLQVTVHMDWHEVNERGAAFFTAFEHALEKRFRDVMLLALKAAQRNAPVGDHNYAIEDLSEIRRAGGSSSSRPANPGGFAIQNSGKHRISKVPGGTLRRALTMLVAGSIKEMLTGQVGVPDSSPAAKYAHIAEIGGTIAAKKARYLRFSPDGQTIIFKPVVHRAAKPYIWPALLEIWPAVQAVPHLAWEEARAAVA
jgi:hypothetical protein